MKYVVVVLVLVEEVALMCSFPLTLTVDSLEMRKDQLMRGFITDLCIGIGVSNQRNPLNCLKIAFCFSILCFRG